MFSYNVFDVKKEILLAVCDIEILGKKINGDISFHVREKFYGGEECGEKELSELAQKATVINAVGKNAVNFLLKEGYVEESKILMIGDIPHAQVVKV